jgi:hypothetical protein
MIWRSSRADARTAIYMEHVLSAYGLDPETHAVQPFGSGHINRTWLALPRAAGQGVVLQQINTNVFKEPRVIARNMRATSAFLAKRAPDYLFLRALPTRDGDDLLEVADGCWRALPYIADTVTLDKADTPEQAFQAARQFGRFARMTDGMPMSEIAPSIPDFHNLALRQSQYERAVDSAQPARRDAAATLIDGFAKRADIVGQFARAKRDLPERLMHHDTKMANVLLRAGSFEGVCVCDLDTMMAGQVISDIGDMVRTYVCPVPEDEPDTNKITIREPFYVALIDGYLSEMGAQLTDAERASVFFAGEFMIYMQGIRFLADFLNGDVYYPVKHDRHNLERARNQWTLLACLTEKRAPLQTAIDQALARAQQTAV